MQVDPIKPRLKPNGTKRLKLKRNELLSISAFKFNLRRYTEVGGTQRQIDRLKEAAIGRVHTLVQ